MCHSQTTIDHLIHRSSLALAFCAFTLTAARVGGQSINSESRADPRAIATQDPGTALTVYLLTMGPGDQVWEKFGHNAIWVHDATAGSDIAYHWGLFDFADKDFIPRFAQGRMRYSMGAFDMSETIGAYRRSNRTVWAQELDLTPAQRQRLAVFLAWNIRPENRHYHYDYYRDNCSTKVRDAIDAALGGPIRTATENLASGSTFRFHTARLTQDDWPIYTGTMIGLGEPVDRPISAWDEMFLPVQMKNRLTSIRISRAGGSVPLVKNERVLVQATRPPEDTEVHRGMIGYLAISVVVLLIGFLLWRMGGRGGRGVGALSLAAAWSLVAGIAGTLLAGLWAFTDHLYSYRNENVLQLTPLSLVLAAFLIRLIWVRRKSSDAARDESAERVALRMARIVAGLSVFGFVLQLLPSLNQVNGSVIALVLPLHLGVVALLIATGGGSVPTEMEPE